MALSLTAKAILAGAAIALSGCGFYDTRDARAPFGAMVGMSVPDLIDCAGVPDHVLQTGPDTAIVQYDHKDSSVGLSATVTLLGSIEFGGGGGCNAVFTVLRDGTVADVLFPASYSNGLFAAPYENCRSLIDECLQHPGATGLPAGYDAFKFLLPAKKD